MTDLINLEVLKKQVDALIDHLIVSVGLIHSLEASCVTSEVCYSQTPAQITAEKFKSCWKSMEPTNR